MADLSFSEERAVCAVELTSGGGCGMKECFQKKKTEDEEEEDNDDEGSEKIS